MNDSPYGDTKDTPYIFCPNCGMVVLGSVVKNINRDILNLNQTYVDCKNCNKKSIVKMKA